MVEGDFNSNLSADDQLEGLPFSTLDSWNFANCISYCFLVELKFKGSQYTWWNGRIEHECIFERLDRVVAS